MAHVPDPVLKHARREAIIIAVAWFLSMAWSCGYSYWAGYIRPGRPLGVEDVRPILGMPLWFFWGVIAPWAACALFTFAFAGGFMADDDLDADGAPGSGRPIGEAPGHERE